jgi:EAL domain-containing protein (putative c-di-GMP-specific phosphodiesterase class I)
VGSDSEAAADLYEIMPVLTDAGTVAAILVAPTERDAQATSPARREVEPIMARHNLQPVFQPIMTLDSHRVIGHEALTRFESGTAPDKVCAKAASAGLGLDLELACLRTAVREARNLEGDGTCLSLNMSPKLLTSSTEAIVSIAADADRPIVLELTEHVVIDGYSPVRVALEGLRPSFRLAVNDVGSGFSSLRHILELRPDFVKLDISLVRDIDQDPGHQTMVAGLVSCALKVGCTLIAERVESTSELTELCSLGVTCAQGSLLGRPVPAAVRQLAERPIKRGPLCFSRPKWPWLGAYRTAPRSIGSCLVFAPGLLEPTGAESATSRPLPLRSLLQAPHGLPGSTRMTPIPGRHDRGSRYAHGGT